MSSSDWLTGRFLREYGAEKQAREKALSRAATKFTPDVAERAAAIYRSYPWMEAGVILALTKANASPETVGRFGALSSDLAMRNYSLDGEENDEPAKKKKRRWYHNIIDNPVTRFLGEVPASTLYNADKIRTGVTQNPVSKFVWNNIAGPSLEFLAPEILKPISRNVVGFGMSVPELINNSPRLTTGRPVDKENGTFGFGDYEGRAGGWASTTLGTMMSGVDAGSGYFPGEKVRETQAERARKYRGTVNGSAYTIGRGTAYNLNLEPGSFMYNMISGALDGVVAFKFDATNVLSAPAARRAIQRARGTEKVIETSVDSIADLQAAAIKSAGMSAVKGAPEQTEAAARFMYLLENNKYLNQLFNRAVEADTPSKVMDLFKHRRTGDYLLEPDDAIAMAQISDPAQMRAFFAQLFSRRRLTPQDLQKYSDPITHEVPTELAEALVRTPAGVLPEKVADLAGAKGAARMFPQFRGVIDDYLEESRLYPWLKRWDSWAPRRALITKGSRQQRLDAITNFDRYLSQYRQFTRPVFEGVQNRVNKLAQTVGAIYRERADRLVDPDLLVVPVREQQRQIENAVATVQRTLGGITRKSTPEEVAAAKQKALDQLTGILGRLRETPHTEDVVSQLEEFREVLLRMPDNPSMTIRESLLDDMIIGMSRTGGRQDVYDVNRAVEEATRIELRELGFEDEWIENLLRERKDAEQAVRMWWRTQTGTPGGAGWIRGLAEMGMVDPADVVRIAGPTGNLDDISVVSPTVVEDLMDGVVILPDFRQLRTAMSPFWSRWLTGNKPARGAATVGRGIAYANDILISTYWKRMALMTFGYTMRNLMDAQIRASILGAKAGFAGLFNDPTDYIMWAISRPGTTYSRPGKRAKIPFAGGSVKGKGGIAGEDWDEMKAMYLMDGLDPLEQVAYEYGMALQRAGNNIYLDNKEKVDKLVRSGRATIADINSADGAQNYITGIVDMGARINAELGVRLAAQGVSTEDALRAVKAVPEYMAELKSLWRGRFTVKANGYFEKDYIRIVEDIDEEFDDLFTIWYERVVQERVEMFRNTGNEDLLIAVMHNRTRPPRGKFINIYADELLDEYGTIMNEAGIGIDSLRPGVVIPRAVLRPDAHKTDLLVLSRTTEDILDPDGNLIGEAVGFRLVEVNVEEAFVLREGQPGSQRMRDIVETAARNGELPPQSLYFLRGGEVAPQRMVQAGIDKGMEKLTGWFFDAVDPAAQRQLEKSPFWRQLYYQVVRENIDLLSPKEARLTIERIELAAKNAKMSPERYIGDSGAPGRLGVVPQRRESTLEALRKQSERADSVGEGTAEELSLFAARIANQRAKEFFFDSVGKRNYEDALRAVSPFAGAWRELLAKWAALAADDPRRIRKAQLVYTGLEGADPDEDGRGFIFDDPNTGKKMFIFPLSNYVGKALTGLDVGLDAPLRQLNVGFATLPGFGPILTAPAALILKDMPSAQWILNLIAPYGVNPDPREALLNMGAPGWFRKAWNSFFGDESKLDSQFATVYLDTMLALNATGKYDLSSQDDVDRLMRETKPKAQVVMGMLAASQFIGPTAGTPSFRVKAGGEMQKDVYVDQLAKEFSKLRSEDFESAVATFLNRYGDDLMLYMASKTRALYDGYEPTKPFLDWAAENENFIANNKEVAGYFGPTSDEFNWSAWNYLITTGKRVRNDGREMIQDAQYMVANAIYREAKLEVGPYPNAEARERLKVFRQQLAEQYPGFSAVAKFEVGGLENFILDLEDAVDERAVKDTQIAQDIRSYLDARREILQTANIKDFKGKKAVRARQVLDSVGMALAEKNPDFQRLYDRKLAQEAEQE